MPGLTRTQRRVARVVLAAAEPYGFALAGGAGLLATGISPRPTEDLDAFAATPDDIQPAVDAVLAGLTAEGFGVDQPLGHPTFARLLVTTGPQRRRRQVKIEMGRDRIEWPVVTTGLGPALSPRELAANKALALFGRVAPRDLCDLATLAGRFDLEEVCADAEVKDPGFSRPILAEMTAMVLGEPDHRWPPGIDLDAVRDFGQRLVEAAQQGTPLHGLAPTTPVWPDPTANTP